MGVISVRISDELEARLAKAGIQPSAVAKAALEGELRRLAVEEQLKVLEGRRYRPRIPVAQAIREIRDE